MKIMAPVDHAEEADPLIDAGARALYFGYMPKSWLGKHSHLESFNRRTFAEAQITSEDEVRTLAGTAARSGVALSAAFNASYYPDWMYGTMLEEVRRLEGMGVESFIVSDPGLIMALGEEGISSLSLSTMGGVLNTRAALFYRDLGVKRITLPRILDMKQITTLCGAVTDMRFDVFALYGACANVESFCRWVHDDPDRVWPCVGKYHPVSPDGMPDETAPASASQMGWAGLPRFWACGLCALYGLASLANVDGLKIVGRGARTEHKLDGVRMIRSLLDALEDGVSRQAFLDRAKSLKRSRSGFGCQPYLCYFPEYL